MKTNKKFILKICTFCLLLLALCVTMPIHSDAAGRISLNKEVTFTLFHEVEGTAVSDVEYSIYKVGNITASGKVSLSDRFSAYGLSLDETDEMSLKNTAEALQGYILRDDIAALDTSKTDANGVVVFPTTGTLKPGLYLVTGRSYTTDDGKLCNIQPILLTLPATDADGGLLYDVKVESKHELLTDTTKMSVLKVWDDKTTHYRPSSIQVQLINHETGKVHSTVELSKANNWRYTWKDLPEGTTWTVVEKTVPEHYTVSYEKDGLTVEITNTSDDTYTPPKEPEKDEPKDKPKEETPKQEPHSPVTGTSTPVKAPQTGTSWWLVPILASLGMLFMIIGVVRRRREE